MEVAFIRPLGGFGDALMCTVPITQWIDRHPEDAVDIFAPYPYAQIFHGLPGMRHGFGVDSEFPEFSKGQSNQAIRSFAWAKYDCVWEMFGPEKRYEDLHAPAIAKHRIDMWCEGVGMEHDGRLPYYQVLPAERKIMDWSWERWGLPDPSKRKIVAIQTASAHPAKDCSLDFWHKVQVKLSNLNIFTVLLGKNAAATWRNSACAAFEILTFRETACILEKCHALLGVDSAYHHLAAALGVPQAVVFGPTDAWLRPGTKPPLKTYQHPKYPKCTVFSWAAFEGCTCWFDRACLKNPNNPAYTEDEQTRQVGASPCMAMFSPSDLTRWVCDELNIGY